MSTAPGDDGLSPLGVLVVIVAMPLVHDAPFGDGAIATVVLFNKRLTTDVTPNPPGVTYAKGAPGCNTTSGVLPVFKDTDAIAHGGFCPDTKQLGGVTPAGIGFGFTYTTKPIVALLNATIAYFVDGTTTTEKGKGAVVPGGSWISPLRLIGLPIMFTVVGVSASSVSVLSPLFTTTPKSAPA